MEVEAGSSLKLTRWIISTWKGSLRTQELVSEVLNIPSEVTFVLIDLAANHFPFVELQLGANALP